MQLRKTDSYMSPAPRPSLSNAIFCILLLLGVGHAVAQSPSVTECTRALNRGDYAQAERLAKSYLRKWPSDVAVRVLLGRAKLARGDFSGAFQQLRKVLAVDPRNVDALYYLSFTARALSQKEYERLFAMDPDSSRVHQLLAEAALEMQDSTRAEEEFQKALQVNPRSAEIATELAELKRSQSKFDDAMAYYMKAAQLGPLQYDVAYGLGACYTYKQDYAEAIAWLKKAVTLDPASAAAHFALGNALVQSGELEQALPELKASLQIEPRMRQAYFLLGRTYTKLGRKDEAAEAFSLLDELDRAVVPGGSARPSDSNSKPQLPKQSR